MIWTEPFTPMQPAVRVEHAGSSGQTLSSPCGWWWGVQPGLLSEARQMNARLRARGWGEVLSPFREMRVSGEGRGEQ